MPRPSSRPEAPDRRITERDATLAAYAHRGRECAYGNLRLLARAVGAVYEDALRPAGLRAGQLSLMWAILATEPVEMSRLSAVTLTDQTTLSRTVEKLRRARLVDVVQGSDARRKLLSLSPLGRERFAAAMPCWEEAQRRVAGLLAVGRVRTLAAGVRGARRHGTASAGEPAIRSASGRKRVPAALAATTASKTR